MKKILTLVAAAVITATATAAADQIAIVGAKVFTMDEQGTLDNATVLVNDGIIEKISANGDVPADYTRIDATGKVVTPGFIGALTSLGLVEVSSSAGVVDSSVEKTPVSATGAALDVSYGVNPDSSLIDITRIEGVTSAATAITYTDHLFHGQGAVIALQDSDPVLKPRAFISVNVGNDGAEDMGGSRAALWVVLEQALAEAAAVNGTLGATDEWHGVNSRADIAALQKVLSGDMPLLMQADRAADIRQIIAFKKRHPEVNVVLIHGVEAWRVADELAANNIPVILDPEYNLPGGFDQMGATLANAGRLEKAGVTVAIGMDTHNIRLATQHAGNAVANGLSYEGGLASLTTGPAKILGVSDQIGSLREGKRADLVIWSGDPLEVTQVAEQVIINGEAIEMSSRQTRLRDRYMTLQQDAEGKPSHFIRP